MAIIQPTCPNKLAQTNASSNRSHLALVNRGAPVHSVLRSLGLENRATIGFPSRGSEAVCEPVVIVQPTCPNKLAQTNASSNRSHLALVNRGAPVHSVLRSLGLENRATIGFPSRGSEAVCEPVAIIQLTCPNKLAQTNASSNRSHLALVNRGAPVHSVLRSLGLENRATIGFPSRGSEAVCEPVAIIQLTCPNKLAQTNASSNRSHLALVNRGAPVHSVLRSLGLENRATIGFPSRGSEAVCQPVVIVQPTCADHSFNAEPKATAPNSFNAEPKATAERSPPRLVVKN